MSLLLIYGPVGDETLYCGTAECRVPRHAVKLKGVCTGNGGVCVLLPKIRSSLQGQSTSSSRATDLKTFLMKNCVLRAGSQTNHDYTTYPEHGNNEQEIKDRN